MSRPYSSLVSLLPLFAFSLSGAEKAAYDSNGRIIALLSNAEDIDISTNVVAVLPTGKRVPLLLRREGRGATRQAGALAWSTPIQLADGGRGRLEYKADEDASAGVKYSLTLNAESPLEVDAIELVVDLPRVQFLKGMVTPSGDTSTALTPVKGASPILYQGETSSLNVKNSAGDLALDILLDKSATVAVVDRWDTFGRSFQVRAVLAKGPIAAGATASIATTLRLTNQPSETSAAHVVLDPAKTLYRFDGFGGNYCWNNQSPVSAYTLNNLKIGWGRTEMKVIQWDKQRDNPGPEIRADMEVMRRFQQMGVPYVISIWWLPERVYTDAYEKPRSAHFRLIKPEKWDETLDLIGGYLLYAKREFGVEPDLFSFNEANIGIYVGLTPETHMEAIKRIGAHFQKLGLKTKMLLGDATGPRDTHKFVLEAAADPEAMRYVGAIGFHSWGGGTPEQYTAWGDVGEWLNLPLLVTELGVDAAAYYTRSWDSYHYGLREARMTQELLTYARPQGTQYWQFTNDYALVRGGRDGAAVEPTARFWLMKHFTDLTPQKSRAIGVSSDQRNLLVTAFRKEDAFAIHILNLGAARDVTVEGLPDGEWQVKESTETAQYQDRAVQRQANASVQLRVPARSLLTLSGKARANSGD